ncbi:MAG: class I SAM-dependent methyltransferase [Crenarchaeota archaeon]|nr:class I SAM-dependent methyltransferase [Thermoproteota archaeon]
MSLLDHYREMARCYKRWYGPFLPEDRDARILDIGCGMGHFLYFLKEEGYRNFLGVDISREQVNFVRKYITDKVVEADAFTFLEGAPFSVRRDCHERFPRAYPQGSRSEFSFPRTSLVERKWKSVCEDD